MAAPRIALRTARSICMACSLPGSDGPSPAASGVAGVAGALEDGDDGAERDGGCTPKSAV
jgi:hypothetical protein